MQTERREIPTSLPDTRFAFGSARRRAPGPEGLPFFGSLFPAWRDPIGLLTRGRETYGDLVRYKFGPYLFFLATDPEIVRHVLVDNAKNYRKSRSYAGLKVVLGEGLLTSEGDHWRRQRKLSQPAFHRERLAGFAATMARATREMLVRWSTEGRSTFDIHREMMRLTFRIVGLTLFSSDVDGDAREVGEALDVALHWANTHAESLLPLPPSVPTPANLRFRRAMRTLDAVVYRLIRERREERRRGTSTKSDLLGLLMEATEEGSSQGMTDEQLRDEIITMIVAGHETTANLLTFAFYLLSEHPHVAEDLRAEASAVFGDRDPALEDVKALELSRAVLEETLRLYPPAWVFERQAIAPDVIGGYPIDRGVVVMLCPYVMHRHPGHWENPLAFDPSRFREAKTTRHRYAYLPFGGGPRTCIGNQFAMMEAQIILSMIVQKTRLELESKGDVALDPSITLRPKRGIRVRRQQL